MTIPNLPQKPFNYQKDCRDKDMPLAAHLSELRSCLIKSLAAILLAAGITFAFMQQILDILTAAAGNLYYMRPAEAFVLYLKISVIGGFILASPVIFYQAYKFIKPALTPQEDTAVLYCLPVTIILGIIGMLFSYHFIFPRSLAFFLSFAAGKITPMLSMESYLSFMIMLITPFAFIFNIPVIITILGKLKLVSMVTLQKYHKHVILASFILAAFITPTPDIITQLLLAMPMVILYEISIILVKFITRGGPLYEQT